MRKRFIISVFIIASLVAAISCSRKENYSDSSVGMEEPVACDVSFEAVPEEFLPETRTVLTDSEIETKKTRIFLGAYQNGSLVCEKEFTVAGGDNLSQMKFKLEKSRTYTVYAIVNAPFSGYPASESSLASMTMDCYNNMAVQGNSMGIPMAGSRTVTIGTSASSYSIPVKRLFAKVSLTMSCNWTGAVISSATVKNLNHSLKPFGSSAWASSTSSTSTYPLFIDSTTGGSSSSMTTVLYVPENIQGTVSAFSGNSASSQKTFDNLTSYWKARLTYLEVEVSSTGLYSGSRTYRVVLGADKLSNCNIVRNSVYNWTLAFDENNLSVNNWKSEADGWNDNRYITSDAEYFVEAIDYYDWTDIFSSNLTSGQVQYTFSVPPGESYDWEDIISDSDPDGFSIETEKIMKTLYVTATAKKNNTSSNVTSTAALNIIYKQIGFDEYDYHVDPGSSVAAEVKYGYYWDTVDPSDWVGIKGKGTGASREWEYTAAPATGITSSYTAGGASTEDRITYTVASTVRPGAYPITASRVSSANIPASADARIVVNDTRYLRWTDRSANYSGEYDYSPDEIHVYLTRGGSGTRSGDYCANAVTYYEFGDITGAGKLYGNTISPYGSSGNKLTDHLMFTFDTDLFALSSFYSGNAWLRCAQNLSAGEYPITLSFTDHTHPITLYVHVAPMETIRPRYEFEHSVYDIMEGSSVVCNIIKHYDRYEDETLVERDCQASETFSLYLGTTTIDDTSIATQSYRTVTGVNYGTTTIRWSYSAYESYAAANVNYSATAEIRVHRTEQRERFEVFDVTTPFTNDEDFSIRNMVPVTTLIYPKNVYYIWLVVARYVDTYTDGVVTEYDTTPEIMDYNSFGFEWREEGGSLLAYTSEDYASNDIAEYPLHVLWVYENAGQTTVSWSNGLTGDAYRGTRKITLIHTEVGFQFDPNNPGGDIPIEYDDNNNQP